MGTINSKYSNKLLQARPGTIIHQCSLYKWLDYDNKAYGFSDTADYATTRDDFRGKGFLVKPDTMDGRYLKVHILSSTKILIEEMKTKQVHKVSIPPCFTSGKIPISLRGNRINVIQNVSQKDASYGMHVIACHGSMAVLQVLNRRQFYFPEFYFVNLISNKCSGKFFLAEDSELLCMNAIYLRIRGKSCYARILMHIMSQRHIYQ